jgi:hypothetical protein
MAGPLIRTEIFRQIETESDRKKYSHNITYSYDTYLLFRMLEIGKVGYIGHVLAKIRVENEMRAVNNAHILQDFYFTYSWLEQSSLMKRIPDAKNTISRIKSNLGFSYLKSLIFKRIQNLVSHQEYCNLLRFADKLVSSKYVMRKLILRLVILFPGLPLFLFQRKIKAITSH